MKKVILSKPRTTFTPAFSPEFLQSLGDYFDSMYFAN